MLLDIFVVELKHMINHKNHGDYHGLSPIHTVHRRNPAPVGKIPL